MELSEVKKKLVNIIQVEKKSQEIENFMKKYNYRTSISFKLQHIIILLFVLSY